MNWGHKITFVITAFIIMMLGMVAVALNQSNELIDSNYYDKELKYQSLIDASHNLNSVEKAALIKQTDEGLVLSIPLSLIENFEEGRLEFLKIENQKQDTTLMFTPAQDGNFKIENSTVSTGLYLARVWWKSQNKAYYREQKLWVR